MGHVARTGQMKNVYKGLAVSCKNLCNEVGSDGVDWVYLICDRKQWLAFVNMTVNIWAS